MLSIEKPYFMNNEEWYYYDEQKFKYILTNKASQEAIDSYNKYYEEALLQYDITNNMIKDIDKYNEK